MSFWIVPARSLRATPLFSATAMYMAISVAAGPLIVIDVETAPRSMSANRSDMSASVSTATPARPTSPSAQGLSESRPIRVGMSNAVDRPVPPALRSSLKRRLVSRAVPNPANIRIVQSLDRYPEANSPRVYGNSPGYGPSPYTGSTGTPDIVSNFASRNGDSAYRFRHCSRASPTVTLNLPS